MMCICGYYIKFACGEANCKIYIEGLTNNKHPRGDCLAHSQLSHGILRRNSKRIYFGITYADNYRGANNCTLQSLY